MVEALSDERIQLEKQRYVYEQHIAGNKRQNLIKKACLAIVNGINPYIDRILNEVHKLTTTVVAYGISYVIASRIFASREW